MRPLTMPRATLAPDVALTMLGASRAGARDAYLIPAAPDGDPFVYLASGIRIGVTDFFEIEATPHAFRLDPLGGYSFPSLGATLAYTGNVFEIGGQFRYFIPIDSEFLENTPSRGNLVLGVPAAIHLGTWGRIDTGAFVSLYFAKDGVGAQLAEISASPFMLDSGIPLEILFNLTEAFWVGVHHGLTIGDFENASDTIALPLGFEIGMTATDDNNPIADLGIQLDLPEFISPGHPEVVHENVYELAVWFRWFHPL